MQVVQIDESLLPEICEAANFEEKTCSDYVNNVLREALRKYRKEKEVSRMYAESYRKFPQELDDSDEEYEHWRKVYEKLEHNQT